MEILLAPVMHKDTLTSKVTALYLWNMIKPHGIMLAHFCLKNIAFNACGMENI